MPYSGLRDKVIAVTGAAGGIGSAVSARLSDEGAKVVLVDLDGDAAASVAAGLPGPAIGLEANVATEEGAAAYVDAAVDAFGRIDGAHLNAGYGGQLVTLVDSEPADFDRVMAVNVRGVYLGLQAVLRRLAEQGDGGAVVVTSSGLGLRGGQLWSAYSASKHAVLGLARSAALEVARDGVRVNAICPGFTDTAMVRPTEDAVGDGDRAAARALLEATVPLGRYAAPAEQAALVAWLLSDDSSYVTGGYFTADGGVDAAAAGFVPPAG